MYWINAQTNIMEEDGLNSGTPFLISHLIIHMTLRKSLTISGKLVGSKTKIHKLKNK